MYYFFKRTHRYLGRGEKRPQSLFLSWTDGVLQERERSWSSLAALPDSELQRCGPHGLLANPALLHPCPEVSRAIPPAGTLGRHTGPGASCCTGCCRTCSMFLRPLMILRSLLWRLVTASRGVSGVTSPTWARMTARARWPQHMPEWEGALSSDGSLASQWSPGPSRVLCAALHSGSLGSVCGAPASTEGRQRGTDTSIDLPLHHRDPHSSGCYLDKQLEKSGLSWRHPALGIRWRCSVTSRTLEAEVSFEGVSPVAATVWFYNLPHRCWWPLCFLQLSALCSPSQRSQSFIFWMSLESGSFPLSASQCRSYLTYGRRALHVSSLLVSFPSMYLYTRNPKYGELFKTEIELGRQLQDLTFFTN